MERRIPYREDARREPYSREKLLRGLSVCRKRLLGADDIEGVVTRVESWLETQTKPDVTSVELGRAVLKELGEVDPVAYVRFSCAPVRECRTVHSGDAPLREESD